VPDQGAGEERATERPVLTLDQFYALVDLMPDRWKAFLLLKTFASLRCERSPRSPGMIFIWNDALAPRKLQSRSPLAGGP